MLQSRYPDFEYDASELSAYDVKFSIFFISLKNGKVVIHKTEKEHEFKDWLSANSIRNIAVNTKNG